MLESKLKAIKGINIATIVIVGLALVAFIALAALLIAGGNLAISNGSLQRMIVSEADNAGVDLSTVISCMDFIIGFVLVLVILEFISLIFILLSAIFNVRNVSKVPCELSYAWSIVGIIFSILGAGIIQLVLFIVSCVLIGQAKKQYLADTSVNFG